MAFEPELLEGRLKSFLTQLQTETGILERIVYKNKNQHRRCSYFQYLLKVRRNLKLLHSVHLEELLDTCFTVVTGRKAKTKAHFLETLKRKKCDGGNFNFLERLRGVARLLSEMVEPILKTATEISTLLARTFFMGFSVMMLALLGRLRVLVQQMLLDVVSLFNEVSSLAQKKQSIKINQDGIEVFREYYPMMEEVVTLDCVWETDKFVLAEKSNKVDRIEVMSLETAQSLRKPLRYRRIGVSLEDDEPDPVNKYAQEGGLDDVSNTKRKRTDQAPSHESNQTDKALVSLNPEGNLENGVQNVTVGDTVLDSSSTSSGSGVYKPNFNLNKKVAFISIAKPTPTTSKAAVVRADEFENKKQSDKETTLFSLFNDDDAQDSIF